jgi:flavodoxin
MAGKNLIVYYSRTGISEVLAKELHAKVGGDIECLHYANREKISYAAAGLEAVRKATSPISGNSHDASDFDKIFFISPVWAGALATPIRSYMATNKEKIQSYVLLVTCGGSGLEGAKKDALTQIGKTPVAAEQFRSVDIKQGVFHLEKFAV